MLLVGAGEGGDNSGGNFFFGERVDGESDGEGNEGIDVEGAG